MDKIGIKATLYDILGYCVPGMFLVLGVYVSFQTRSELSLSSISQVNVTLSFGMVSLGVFYLSGHFLASLGSFFFENKLVTKLIKRIYDFDTTKYDEKSNEIFNLPYDELGRIAMSYCQQNYPVIYETAFSFLTIYGFSRNCATALSITCFFMYINGFFTNVCEIIVFFIFILFIIHNYFRFRVYYTHQIASSIMVKKETA